jgi:uncharacterized protein (DUF305 family)
MTTQEDTGTEDTAKVPAQARGRSPHVLVYAAAALVLLLVGAAVGMLLTTVADSDSGTPGADSVDVGFCQDMRMHHLQAVTMASIARDRSADAAVLSIAFDIEGGQLTQIGMMGGWLNLWERPAYADRGQHLAWLPGAADHNTHGSSGEGAAVMPGMATTEELDRLRSLAGPEFDVYFLQLMLRHHQGGLAMARHAADHAGTGVVRNLANKIVRAQEHENRVMTDMLTERGAQPLPPTS